VRATNQSATHVKQVQVYAPLGGDRPRHHRLDPSPGSVATFATHQ